MNNELEVCVALAGEGDAKGTTPPRALSRNRSRALTDTF